MPDPQSLSKPLLDYGVMGVVVIAMAAVVVVLWKWGTSLNSVVERNTSSSERHTETLIKNTIAVETMCESIATMTKEVQSQSERNAKAQSQVLDAFIHALKDK